MPQPVISLEKVSKSYRDADGRETLSILREVDFALGAGESAAIIGPSGSGKSTLLNIIGTLDHPTSGRVLLNGADLTSLDDLQLASARNQQIGFIFQGHHLLPQCTTLENVLVPTLATPGKRDQTALKTRAEQLLNRVGLGQRMNHRPGQLSGGERQRAAVVRALINSPKLLLADEPTGALDAASAATMAELLAQLNKEENVTLIVVTHALDLARKMQKIYQLKEGRLIPG